MINIIMSMILPLAEEAKGRCHSCRYLTRYDIPSGGRAWCRIFSKEMTDQQASEVIACLRWKALSDTRRGLAPRLSANVLVSPLLDGEDRLFDFLRRHLEYYNVSLSSLMIIAHPFLAGSLGWIETLPQRFERENLPSAKLTINYLHESGHHEVARLAAKIII